MKNKLSLFKTGFNLFFLSTLIFTLSMLFLSCSKDDNKQYFVSDPGYILLDSQVIGPTGGEINLDSIIVNIPNGAFNENTELSVYVGEENDGFDEYANSSLFQISGLPNTINKPIKLNLKYNGIIKGDTLVAIGEMKHVVSLDSTLFSYIANNASDSSGYLVYELPGYANVAKLASSKNNLSPNPINTVVLDGQNTFDSSRGNFEITCPAQLREQGIKMGEYFEEAYDKCADNNGMNLNLSEREWSDYPAKVLVKSLGGDDGNYGEHVQIGFSDDDIIGRLEHGSFEIDPNTLNDDLKLKVTCGHEFLHLVQNHYEFNSLQTPQQHWLQEATSTWIEERYANITDYVSGVQIGGREIYPFDGWNFSGRDYDDHGYGLAVIIKGIVQLYGDGAIRTIFENIKAGSLPLDPTDPVEAVLSVITHPVGTFWHNLLSWYTLGEAYGNQVNFKFLDKIDNYKGTALIDPSFTTQSIKLGYHDLSGKLFKVQSGDLSDLTEIPLTFSVDDKENCGILVCKLKQGYEIVSIGEVFPGNDGIVAIDDVKPIFDDGYEIVVMVSNSSHDKNSNYQGTNDVELTIERPVVIKNIDFRIQCEGSYQTNTNLHINALGRDTTYSFKSRVTITNFKSSQDIKVAGNTITMIADSTDQIGYTYQTFLVIDVDDIKNPQIVKSFMCTDIVIYQDENTNTRDEKSASGTNISRTTIYNPIRFEIEGSVAANINDFKHEFTGNYGIYNPPGYETKTMLGYDGAIDGRINFIINFGED